MKDKILAMLKTKYNGVQVVVLDGVADVLSKTVTEESQIETAIGGVGPFIEPFAKLLQKEGDRRATEATTSAISNYEAKHNLKEGKHKEGKPNGGNDDEMPQWAKDLQAQLEKQNKEKSKDALIAKVTEKLKGKNVPASFLKGRSIEVESEEQVDAAVESVVGAYTEFRQDLVNSGVIVDPPAGGGGDPKAVDADIEAWAGAGKSKP